VRILLSCLQSLRPHEIPAHSFWRDYFVRGAAEAGFEVIEVPGVDWAEGITDLTTAAAEAWREQTWARTLEFARQEQARDGLDFFLGYLYPQQIEPAAIAELRRGGTPCVNFFCDNVREFRSVPGVYRGFDLHWVPEFEALPMYAAAGFPRVHAPMPCWIPESLRAVPERETEPPTFIGSADLLRRQLFGDAIADGAALTIRGPGWGSDAPMKRGVSRSGGLLVNQRALVARHGWSAVAAKISDRLTPLRVTPVPESCFSHAVYGDEYLRVTREARVTLGVNRVPVTRRPLRRPLLYSRLRDIEAPMLGACYLTEHCEGVAHLYDVGREIETYSTAAELAEKLRMLERDGRRRAAMRAAGQRRALSEHSVAATLGRVVEVLGLGKNVGLGRRTAAP
jgi:hypothetical protein